MNLTQSEVIKDKAHLFLVWEREQKRFKKLFSKLSENELAKKAITSGCGHKIGDHIPCMLIWMEDAIKYFENKKNNKPEVKIGSIVEHTTKRLKEYGTKPYNETWKKLEEIEKKYKEVIKDWDENKLFQDKDMWEWLSWSTFGHYDEHSTELEDQLAGKTSISAEKEWVSAKS